MRIVGGNGFISVAFPISGYGSGNRSRNHALDLVLHEFGGIDSSARVLVDGLLPRL
jgi:hypothetical protein